MAFKWHASALKWRESALKWRYKNGVKMALKWRKMALKWLLFTLLRIIFARVVVHAVHDPRVEVIKEGIREDLSQKNT